jgi:hypothetical protein
MTIASARSYAGLPELTYPFLSASQEDQYLHRAGGPETRIWLVSFMQYDLGYFDLEQKTLQPIDNRSARGCHPCLRYVVLPMCPGWT